MKILIKPKKRALELVKTIGREKTLNLIKFSGLSGRGGANFPTGSKWEEALKQEKEIVLICNADEGEPGRFKDRFIIESNPELLIEGILIASYVLNSKENFIYLRQEYEMFKKNLDKAIKEYSAKEKIKVIVSEGAYICGEETSIINALEGRRPEPRKKPPYPTEEGYFKKPTVINNVETLANIPLIFIDEDWSNETRLFCVSGDVNNKGVIETSLNSSLKNIIKKSEPRGKVKAVFLGASGGCVPYKDLKMNETCEGVCLGTGDLIVVAEYRSIVDICTIIAKFFEYESCGKCTPCREGCLRVLEILEKISLGKATKVDLDLLEETAQVIKEASFCGFGNSASNHIITALKHFNGEFSQKCK